MHPATRFWTEEQRTRIIDGRKRGDPWSHIAKSLGLPKASVVEYGQKLLAAGGGTATQLDRAYYSRAEPLPAGCALALDVLANAERLLREENDGRNNRRMPDGPGLAVVYRPPMGGNVHGVQPAGRRRRAGRVAPAATSAAA